MFNYRIYGLNISSTRGISLLDEQEFDSADLTVNWSTGSDDFRFDSFVWKPVRSDLLDLMDEVSVWETGGSEGQITKAVLNTFDGNSMTFIYDTRGNELFVLYSKKELQSNLESYFVGPIMSFVLRLRGQVCLHSSAASIDGKAVAFLGHSTAGKSTIAAGMAKAGATILADDIVALSKRDAEFIVHPGYSRVRLRPKAAKFLTPDSKTLERVYSYRDSFYYALDDLRHFEANALPLAAIYLLGNIGDDFREPSIEPVPPQERLIKLVENASGTYVIRGKRRADEFATLSLIAQTVPMRKLFYAHDIATLPKQCELILEDIRKLTRTASAHC